jgi:glyoxylase-like metal-dependent hydrolase (beta-lactamase superfamily II)
MISRKHKDFHNTQPPSLISRRDLLKGLGIGAVGAGLGLGVHIVPVAAQSSGAMEQVVALHRFHVGELELTVIQDGAIGFPPPFLAVNAPEEDVVALMNENSLGTELAPLSVGIVLVKSGDRLILLDNGSGRSTFTTEFFGDNIGRLMPTLELIDVSPETITDVVLSHYHPDHLGGTLTDNSLTFPNAQHYLPQIEWDYLRSGDIDEFFVPFVEFANSQLQPLADNDGQLAFYGDEDEVVPGIQAIETLGHSAGHHSFMLESNGQQLLLPIDVFPHQVIHLRHPEWFAGVDQIPELAVETRQQLLARTADEQIPILAFHFPFPGIGNILRDGDAYRFLPTN